MYGRQLVTFLTDLEAGSDAGLVRTKRLPGTDEIAINDFKWLLSEDISLIS